MADKQTQITGRFPTHRADQYTPQCQELLRHFIDKGSITAVEAAAVYRMRALPRRVRDLKEMGHFIETTFHFDPTGQRYGRYRYVKGPTVTGLEPEKKVARVQTRKQRAAKTGGE